VRSMPHSAPPPATRSQAVSPHSDYISYALTGLSMRSSRWVLFLSCSTWHGSFAAVFGWQWVIAGVIMAITIVGLPWARAAFSIAGYTLLPLGQTAVSRAEYYGRTDIGTGPLGAIGNLIWLVLAGRCGLPLLMLPRRFSSPLR
jgi:hypothetical protein